jgi:fatty acid desaturase
MQYQVRWKHIDKDLTKVSSWRGIRDLALVWIAVLAIAAIASRLASFDIIGALICLAAFLAIGILQNGMSSLSHHAVHVNLHPKLAVNDQLFRWLLAAPMGQSYLALRREHLRHHARFAEADDPERFYYDLDVGNRNTVPRFVWWCLRMFLGGVVIGQVRRVLFGSRNAATMVPDPPESPERAARERREYLYVVPAQAVVFGMMWAVTGNLHGYLVFWLLPLVTIGVGLNAMRATIEHADPAQHGGAYRTFLSGPIESFIVGPFNFDHHYEHHRFMSVPYYRVAKIRELLTNAGDYKDCTQEPSYHARYQQILRDLRARAIPAAH